MRKGKMKRILIPWVGLIAFLGMLMSPLATPSYAAGEPGGMACVAAVNPIDCAYVTQANALGHVYYSSNGHWYTDLPNADEADKATACIIPGNPIPELEMFGIGTFGPTDAALLWEYYNGGWSSLTYISGPFVNGSTGGMRAVTCEYQYGVLFVFVIASDGNLWQNYWRFGVGWNYWQESTGI